jgi:uncharacterized membrane protein
MIDNLIATLKEKLTDTAVVCKVLYLLAAAHVGFLFIAAFNQSVWVDEACTLDMIKFPFGKLWEIVTTDVHPPLYFFYVKFFVNTITAITSLTIITAAQMASTLPVIILVILGKTKVAKNWGELCGAVFAFCMAAMPQMLTYGTEIRMYSLGLLFVTLSFIYAYETAKAPKLRKFVLLMAFSALSAWTHNFACVSAVFVYAALAVWFLRKGDKKPLLTLFVSGVGVVVLYVPWLSTALTAFRNVSNGFWIEDITLKTFIQWGMFPFQFRKDRVSSIIFCLIVLAVGMRFLFSRSKKKDAFNFHFALSGVAVPVCTVLVGMIVSYLVTPIFTPRYMFPALGCFWLAFAICHLPFA